MDHLPRAAGSSLPPIEIPLYVKPEHQWETNSEYSNFIESKGFSVADIIRGNLGDRSKEDVLSVVQLWGFFGTLISIFRTVMVPLDINQFIRKSDDGARVITTEPLINHIRIWIYHERSRLPEDGKQQRAEAIRDILLTLSKFIRDVLDVEMNGHTFSSQDEIMNPDRSNLHAIKNQFAESGEYHHFEKIFDDSFYERNENFFTGPLCGKGYEIVRDGITWSARAWSGSHMLILSLSILGEAMDAARKICYKGSSSIRFNAPMSISALLGFNGWCPVDAMRVTAIASTSELYFLTTVDVSSEKNKHQGCCTTGCVAYQITDSTYKGKHVTPDCTCEYISLKKDIGFIEDAVNRGEIPLVFVHGDKDNGKSGIGLTAWGGDPVSDRCPFVAISHVWADGIGNTEENAIPKCQLHRLQCAVNGLYPEETRVKPAVPFWIDTLLVPIEAKAKAKAIAQMEHIYRSADKVLVLDSSLEPIDAETDPQELMMRIYLCPWMGRLWTLQEAFLAKRLYFKFRNKCMGIRVLTRTFRLKLLRADMQQFEQLRNSEATKLDPDVYTYPKALEEMLMDRMVAFMQSESKITEHDDELALYPVWTFPMHQLVFLRMNAWRSQSEETEHHHLDFSQMTSPMHYRASSKIEDEPLCLAVLAGAPASSLLQFPPDCRMEQLFGQFDKVPSGIIFSEKPRVHKPARKWIPTSLLNSSNFYGGPPAEPTPDGLLVRFGGIFLGPLGENKLFPCRHSAPDGLFYLKHGDEYILCRFKAKHYSLIPEKDKDSSFGHDPKFGIHAHSDINYRHWSVEDGNVALVFNCRAVMAEWNGEVNAALVSFWRVDGKEYILTSFIIALWLERIRTEAGKTLDVPMLSAVEILDDQLWCIG